MKPRVIIYSTAYYPIIGGAEVAIREITDRLPNFDFVLITARLKKSLPKLEVIGNTKVYRLGVGCPLDKLWLAFWGGYFGARLAKEEGSFSIVWGVMASFAGLSALRFKELRPDTSFLLTLQEGDDLVSVERKMFLLKWRFRKIFSSADYIQAISHYLADWARRMGSSVPVEIVPNGVDLEKYVFRGRKKNHLIITTSRLVKKNGLDTLVRAMIFLPKDYKLQIIGVGSELSALKNLVSKFKLIDRVLFVGFVPNSEIPNYLAEAEIFSRPARSEGLGNSFLEAMAVGLPVIAPPVGGIVDFLREGETGWLVGPDEPIALADKIKALTLEANCSQVDEVVLRARRLVEENYNWDKIADKMADILAKLNG